MEKKEIIQHVIDSHNLMHIATVDAAGAPHVRGVDYVGGDEENTLLFITNRASRKIEHIRNNPAVSVAIDRDCPEWEELAKLQYIKGSGTAEILEDPQDVQDVFSRLVVKFPFFKDFPVDAAQFVAVRVRLQEVYLTDNTISFGHTDTIRY
ncbi:MAG: hypothetical protein Kow0089_23410 [Desulfobulbaceae bacterium]